MSVCTQDSLELTIDRDNAILLEEYDRITRTMTINFMCNCGEVTSKNCFQLIGVSGAFCKKWVHSTNIIMPVDSTANLAIRLVPFVPHADAKDSLN